MTLAGKILFTIGVIYTFVGIIVKSFSINFLDGAGFILIGIMTGIIAIGTFVKNNNQSVKHKVIEWTFFFLLLFGGILSILKD